MNTLFDDVIKSINRVFEKIETETPKENKEEIAKKAKQLVDEAIGNVKSKKPEEKIIHLHSYKVPENELRTGLIQKNGDHILVFCQKHEDEIYPLASFVIEHPERLRELAKAMNTFAENMEKEIAIETTP